MTVGGSRWFMFWVVMFYDISSFTWFGQIHGQARPKETQLKQPNKSSARLELYRRLNEGLKEPGPPWFFKAIIWDPSMVWASIWMTPMIQSLCNQLSDVIQAILLGAFKVSRGLLLVEIGTHFDVSMSTCSGQVSDQCISFTMLNFNIFLA